MMKRDSLFHQKIVWSGAPSVIVTPPILRAFALLLFLSSAIALAFAFILALVIEQSPTAMLAFSFWCVTCGIGSLLAPKIWFSRVEYLVTEHQIIWKRGPFRRSIERSSISFARIFWDPKHPGMGDLELVRAVPTGALRRRLILRLTGVNSPDRVWAIIRGEEAVAPIAVGARALAQRLDQDERVLWSSKPTQQWRAYLPHGQRDWMLLFICAVLLFASVRLVATGTRALELLNSGGLEVWPLLTIALCLLVTVGLLLSIAGYLVYDALIRSGRLLRQTQYLITNKRVLIQRADEELHLDRKRIVDVIDAPLGEGLSDVFIVLDGPRARSLALSGAFGELERSAYLRPVFFAVTDADGAGKLLRQAP
ncbi:MAG: hypothetical protein SFV15_18220 [Polyangiaceae bacterium]|nr:hypothetical protein [Polyangiaceae bacterium]